MRVLSPADLLSDHCGGGEGVVPGLDLPGKLAPGAGVAETQHAHVVTARALGKREERVSVALVVVTYSTSIIAP